MQQSEKRKSKTSRIKSLPQETRAASLKRRLKALGIDDDNPPKDIDEFHQALARRIAMFINNWRGCPELLCRRQRGCMAPRNICSNRQSRIPLTPKGEQLLRAKVYRAIHDELARRGGQRR
jgi:hypothetical protein